MSFRLTKYKCDVSYCMDCLFNTCLGKLLASGALLGGTRDCTKLKIGVIRVHFFIDSCTTQVSNLSDNSEVWSDILSDQRIRREPKGLTYVCLVDCQSDHDVRSIMCMV